MDSDSAERRAPDDDEEGNYGAIAVAEEERKVCKVGSEMENMAMANDTPRSEGEGGREGGSPPVIVINRRRRNPASNTALNRRLITDSRWETVD